jgi:hypothetical protein
MQLTDILMLIFLGLWILGLGIFGDRILSLGYRTRLIIMCSAIVVFGTLITLRHL